MRVRLKFKEAYTWPSRDPQNPNKNTIGFIQTEVFVPMGGTIVFEDFYPDSYGGDLNVDHYKYFMGRRFQRVEPPNSYIKYEFVEL